MALLAQAPGPTPRSLEAMRAAFVQGDLAKAAEAGKACARKEPRRCRPLVKALGQYLPLARAVDKLSPAQARVFLALDRQLSPGTPGAVTRKAIEKFVTSPLDLARHHGQQGNPASARVIARQVLEVDPANPEALALAAETP
jgi:hypothetical protein